MTALRSLRGNAAAWVLGVSACALAPSSFVLAQSTNPQVNLQQRAQYQQNVRQQQLSNQLRDNRISEQQRQQISDDIKRPYANDPGIVRQIQQADQARQAQYEAHQQALLDNYESAAKSHPLPHGKPPPSKPSSNGG